MFSRLLEAVVSGGLGTSLQTWENFIQVFSCGTKLDVICHPIIMSKSRETHHHRSECPSYILQLSCSKFVPLSFNEAGKVLQRSPVQETDASNSYQIHSLLAPCGQCCRAFQGVCISRSSKQMRKMPRQLVDKIREGQSLSSEKKGCFSFKS